jgi:hypothetical protein
VQSFYWKGQDGGAQLIALRLFHASHCMIKTARMFFAKDEMMQWLCVFLYDHANQATKASTKHDETRKITLFAHYLQMTSPCVQTGRSSKI